MGATAPVVVAVKTPVAAQPSCRKESATVCDGVKPRADAVALRTQLLEPVTLPWYVMPEALTTTLKLAQGPEPVECCVTP